MFFGLFRIKNLVKKRYEKYKDYKFLNRELTIEELSCFSYPHYILDF